MKFLLCLIIIALPMLAQEGDLRFAPYQFEIDPMPVPASATAVPGAAGTQTVYVNEITLTNTGASDLSCDIKDKQGTPRALFSGKVLAGSVYVFSFKGRKMPGGITWSCANGTDVIGYIQYSKGRY